MTVDNRTLHWIAFGESRSCSSAAFASAFDDLEVSTYEEAQSGLAVDTSAGLAFAAGAGQSEALEGLLADLEVAAVCVELPETAEARAEVAAAIHTSGWAVDTLTPSPRSTWLALLKRAEAGEAVVPHVVPAVTPDAPAETDWPAVLPKKQVVAKTRSVKAAKNGRTARTSRRAKRRRQAIFASVSLGFVSAVVAGGLLVSLAAFVLYETRSHVIGALVLSGVAVQAASLVGVVYIARHIRDTRLHRDRIDAGLVRRLERLERASRAQDERAERGHRSMHAAIADVARAVEDVSVQASRGLAKVTDATVRGQLVLARQLLALERLDALVPRTGPTPPMGGWVASPDLVVLLVETMIQRRPAVVVECGSGVTTLFLALAADQHDIDCRIVSLDHDPDSAARTRELLASHGVGHRAEVRHAPLHDAALPGQEAPWYDLRSLIDVDEVALLIVGGPPESCGPEARYRAMPALAGRFAAEAVVVVDDLRHPEGRRAVRRWAEEFADFELELRDDLEKHAGLLTRRM